MSTAASRMRKRDNAETLGELQMTVREWFETTPGQLALIGIVVVAVVLAGLVGP